MQYAQKESHRKPWYDGDMSGTEELLAAIKQLQGHGSIAQGLLQTLDPLINYDTQHDADLVHTLTTFVQLGGSSVATAESLFLHRNSVTYRLQRIQDISGLDARDPELRRLLMAALLLADQRLLHEIGAVTRRTNYAGERKK
ncbi:MAG: hypothetical protein BZY82_03905 [SAR202 cluster bacterium Io17-Chloro-G3]|nr:MAG: hypothetical protein BZY82_03905 [SAR202 cluster bacterium Io17-Chloro-G3]